MVLRGVVTEAEINPMNARKVARSFWPSLRTRALVAAVLLGGGLLFTACAGPARTGASTLATVMVENHSGYMWQVDFFKGTSNAAVAGVLLGSRERRSLRLVPGGYRVHSRVAGVGEAERVSEPTGRAAEVELRGGRTYVWPLGTLLSAETPGP